MLKLFNRLISDKTSCGGYTSKETLNAKCPYSSSNKLSQSVIWSNHFTFAFIFRKTIVLFFDFCLSQISLNVTRYAKMYYALKSYVLCDEVVIVAHARDRTAQTTPRFEC